MSDLVKAAQRICYYMQHSYRAFCPQSWASRRTQKLLQKLASLPQSQQDRVAYYCRLHPLHPTPTTRIDKVSRKKSRYFLDFMRHARGFPQDAKVDTVLAMSPMSRSCHPLSKAGPLEQTTKTPSSCH